jgi:hypothetical protein
VSTSDALIALAQFSLTLAGFIGALVAFVGRGGRWHPADSFRARRALSASLGVGFMAMLPLALGLFGVAGDALWRISSALAACYGAFWLGCDAPRYWRERAELRGVVPRWGAVAVYASALGVIAALGGLALALIPPGPGVYFASQLHALLLPAAVFARVPFVRPAVTPAPAPHRHRQTAASLAAPSEPLTAADAPPAFGGRRRGRA